MIVVHTLHGLLFEAVDAVKRLPPGSILDMNVWVDPPAISMEGAWLMFRHSGRVISAEEFEEHFRYITGDPPKKMFEGYCMEILSSMRTGRFLEAYAMLYGAFAREAVDGRFNATMRTPKWDILETASIVVRDTLVHEPAEMQRAEWYSYERAARLLKEHGI